LHFFFTKILPLIGELTFLTAAGLTVSIRGPPVRAKNEAILFWNRIKTYH